MSAGWWVGGSVAGALCVAPLLLVVALQKPPQAPVVPSGPGGALDPSKVPAQYVQIITDAAKTCPEETPALLAAQLQQESGWNPRAVSPVGALGIAQFMPGTWAAYGRGGDVFNPADAIPAQARLMCDLFAQMTSAAKSGQVNRGTPTENALAAYNAGPGNVFRSNGFPTGIGETDSYVPNIIALAGKLSLNPAGVGGSAGAAAAVEVGKRYLGVPYVWGGGDLNGPTGYMGGDGPPVGFDCSGFTQHSVWQATHIDIGGVTNEQMSTPSLKTILTRNAGDPMPLAQMAVGDVVLINFHPSTDGAWGHVVFYIGNGQFMHAPHTGDVIKIAPASNFDNADWIVRRLP